LASSHGQHLPGCVYYGWHVFDVSLFLHHEAPAICQDHHRMPKSSSHVAAFWIQYIASFALMPGTPASLRVRLRLLLLHCHLVLVVQGVMPLRHLCPRRPPHLWRPLFFCQLTFLPPTTPTCARALPVKTRARLAGHIPHTRHRHHEHGNSGTEHVRRRQPAAAARVPSATSGARRFTSSPWWGRASRSAPWGRRPSGPGRRPGRAAGSWDPSCRSGPREA